LNEAMALDRETSTKAIASSSTKSNKKNKVTENKNFGFQTQKPTSKARPAEASYQAINYT